jgi:molybdenum cofactor guanylyltransferase
MDEGSIMPTCYDLTGVVLAGGGSHRMGRPKANLSLGGETLVDIALSRLALVCRDVLLVCRRPADFLSRDVRMVRDLDVGLGPLGGLITGFFYARYPWVLVVACDIPFLEVGILDLLARKTKTAGPGPVALVPRTEKGWQPLVAAYSVSCLKPARRFLARGGRKVDDLRFHGIRWVSIPESEIRAIDPELSSFHNVNTPDDYEWARGRIRRHDGG